MSASPLPRPVLGVAEVPVFDLSVSYSCPARVVGYVCVKGAGAAASGWPGQRCNVGHPMLHVSDTAGWSAA